LNRQHTPIKVWGKALEKECGMNNSRWVELSCGVSVVMGVVAIATLITDEEPLLVSPPKAEVSHPTVIQKSTIPEAYVVMLTADISVPANGENFRDDLFDAMEKVISKKLANDNQFSNNSDNIAAALIKALKENNPNSLPPTTSKTDDQLKFNGQIVCIGTGESRTISLKNAFIEISTENGQKAIVSFSNTDAINLTKMGKKGNSPTITPEDVKQEQQPQSMTPADQFIKNLALTMWAQQRST
jgi:hypothetical protein